MLTLQITTGVQCMCYRLVFVVYVVCELLHCMYCPCRALEHVLVKGARVKGSLAQEHVWGTACWLLV